MILNYPRFIYLDTTVSYDNVYVYEVIQYHVEYKLIGLISNRVFIRYYAIRELYLPMIALSIDTNG